MMCNAYECPFRNDMGYCKITACIRRDLAEKYNSFYTTDYTTTGFPTYKNRTIDKGGDERISTLPMPPFPSGTVQNQIMQLYSYLFSMAQTLNVLIANIEDIKGGDE